MNICLVFSTPLGQAKMWLLQQLFQRAVQLQHQHWTALSQADIAIVLGKNLPKRTALQGKKVYLVGTEQAFLSPEKTVENALIQAELYPFNDEISVENSAVSTRNIVAITACPTGVAHTFMAAEAIESYAQKMGWNVQVETRGQVGVGNPLSDEAITKADLVFVAADIDVDLTKFQGKLMYRTSTGLALKKTAEEFEKAFAQAEIYSLVKNTTESSVQTEQKGFYQHLMTGVSYMLPIVVAGGLLVALAFAIGGVNVGDAVNAGTLGNELIKLGGTAFSLMIAVFAGYVAYSIADRPGLAVGLVAGMLASQAGAGILGGIIAGFLSGYTVKTLNTAIKLPASMQSLKPILILPLFGTALVGLVMVYWLNPPVAFAMEWLENWLKSLGSVNAILLGALLGGMMCVDMGGPINKAAYVFGTGLLTSHIDTPMAAIMAAGMVPPLGMAIATWIARPKFTPAQHNAGNAAFVLGLCFISEGALPFVAADPVRVIFASVLGGATAGAISMSFNISLPAPHGGLFVVPLVSQPLIYLAAIAVGALVTGIVYSIIKPKLKEN